MTTCLKQPIYSLRPYEKMHLELFSHFLLFLTKFLRLLAVMFSEKVSFQGPPPSLFIISKWWSFYIRLTTWKKGNAQYFRHMFFCCPSYTYLISKVVLTLEPAVIIFGFNNVLQYLHCNYQERQSKDLEVASRQSSAECSPSIKTSGSTIGPYYFFVQFSVLS